MKTLNGYSVSREEIGKYTLQLHFEDEITSPQELYMEDEDISDIIKGKYTWCIAVVTVFKNGIELASNSIGGCTYNYDNIINEFKESGYYEDMVKETMDEADKVLTELCK
jgi:hypothetical protein